MPLLLLADDAAEQIELYFERGEAWVLEAGSKAVGVAIAELIAEQPPARGRAREPRRVEVHNIAVSPEYQRLGLGSALLDAVTTYAQGVSAGTVHLAAAFEDRAAVQFYLKSGFRPVSLDLGWFNPERGYPADLEVDGVPVRDRVWLARPVPRA